MVVSSGFEKIGLGSDDRLPFLALEVHSLAVLVLVAHELEKIVGLDVGSKWLEGLRGSFVIEEVHFVAVVFVGVHLVLHDLC